jgi:hypothetical protein
MEYKKRLKEIKQKIIEREKKSLKKKTKADIYEFFDIDSCLCTDSKNYFKDLYISEHEAEKVAKFLLDEYGVTLFIYPCPYSYGWHLTRG